MTDVNVLVRTQRIIVDPFSSSVAVINAGPMGPTGPQGEIGPNQLESTLSEAIAREESDSRMTPKRAGDIELHWDVRRSIAGVPGVVMGFGIDNTAALQAANDHVASLGGGTLLIPAGILETSGVILSSKITLKGAGRGVTWIWHRAGATNHMIRVATNATQVTLQDFSINGNRSNQINVVNAIHLDNSAGLSSTLAKHKVVDIHIENVKGSGLYLGTYIRSSQIRGITAYFCDLYGVQGVSFADSIVSDVEVGQSGGHGMWLNGCNSVQWSNLRAWYSGRLTPGVSGVGIYFRNGSNHQISNVYTQENSGYGMLIWGQAGPLKGVSIAGATLDSDNAGAAGLASLALNNVIDSTCVGVRVGKFTGAIGTPVNALLLAGGSTGNTIQLVYSDLSGVPIVGTDIGKNVVILPKVDEITPYLYGAVGDGIADDTAAMQAAANVGATVVCRGTFKITAPIVITVNGASFRGVNQWGFSTSQSRIIQATDGQPIFVLDDVRGVIIEKLGLEYVTKSTLAGSIAITTDGIVGNCAFRDLFIRNAGVGIGMDQARTQSTIFSSIFENIRVNEYGVSGIDMRMKNGGATGCTFDVIYINAGGGLTPGGPTITGVPLRIAQAHDFSFRALHVEGVSTGVGIEISNVYGLRIESVHVEGFTANVTNSGFIRVIGGNQNTIQIDVIDIYTSWFRAAEGVTAYYVVLHDSAANSMMNIDFVHVASTVDITGNATFYPLGAFGAGDITLSKSSMAVGSNRPNYTTNDRPIVRHFNGVDSWRTGGRPTSLDTHRLREIWRTRAEGAPTTGTWRVGDKVWFLDPLSGGSIGLVCVTAGTPGSWKTFGPIGTTINVADYGATGNGVSDDTTAIQNAIEAAAVIATATGSAEVEFPTGHTYRITAALNMRTGVSYVGGGTIYQATANLSILDSAGTGNVNDVRIDGLRFTGLVAAGAVGGRGAIRFSDDGTATPCRRIRISNILIDTVGTSGITFDNTHDAVISNVVIRRPAEHGIYVSSESTGVAISGVSISEAGYNTGVTGIVGALGIKVRADDVVIDDFLIDGVTGGGVLFEATSPDISHNCVASNGVVRNCTTEALRFGELVEDCHYHNIQVEACANGVRDMGSIRSSVKNCSFAVTTSGFLGTNTVGPTFLIIEGNTFISCASHAVSITNGGNGSHISRNKVLSGVAGGYAVPETVMVELLNGHKILPYAASITPDKWEGDVFEVTLAGALTINSPGNVTSGMPRGRRITYILKQDASGGRITTWNSIYKTTEPLNTTPNSVNIISFVSDGVSMLQTSSSGTELSSQLNAKSFGAIGNGTTNDTVALQSFITACIASGKTGKIPAGNYICTATLNIPDSVTIIGDPHKSILSFSGAITNAINITAAAYVHLEGFRITGSAGAVNGFVSAYNGGSTSYRHKFIDCNASSFTGRGFASYNNEHALWERCYAFACGVGFYHDASLGIQGANIQNRWVQCRAQQCTSHGFELQTQVDFFLEAEGLDCGGTQVWVKSVCSNGDIAVDVERPTLTPASTGIGLQLSGSGHVVRSVMAYNMATAVNVSFATNCIIQAVRKSVTTNGIIFANEPNSRHLVLDRTIDITDAAPNNTLNFRIENASNQFQVRNFGAKGDGTTDDTLAVQAAITAAAVVKGKVVISGGTFLVGNLTVPGGVHIAGDSQGGAKLLAKIGTTGSLLQISSFCQVSDLWIDCNAQNVIGLRGWQSARSMLSNLYVTNSLNSGIVLEGDSAGFASHAMKLSDISVFDCDGTGIILGNFAYDTLLDNIWIGTCGTGARFATGAQRVSNLHIWGSAGDGLFLDPGTNTNLVNAYIESNVGRGIYVNGASGGFSLVGGRIWKNGNKGVYVLGGSHARISSTVFDDNVGEGILFENHLNGDVIGCHFYAFTTPGSQTYGIRSIGTSNFLRITANDVLDSQHSVAGISTVGIQDKQFGNVTNTDRNVPLVHSLAGTASTVSVDSPPGQLADIQFRSDLSSRWQIRKTNTAETGGDVGSDFQIIARTDTGAFKSTPVSITRSTGRVRVTTDLELDAQFDHDGTTVGFYGVTPVTKPTSVTPGQALEAVGLGATLIESFIPVERYAADTNPLQSAINAGVASGLPVHLSKPVTVSATITATGPFSLIGQGHNAKILASAATFNIFELTVANDGSVFENLTFIGAATNDTTTQFCISQNGTTPSANSVTVRNVRIVPNDAGTAAANNGVKVYDADDWLIEGLYVKNLWGQDLPNTGYGVLTGRSNRIHVSDSIFIASASRGRHAVYLTVASSDCTVSNVTATGYRRSAIITKAGPTGESCDRNLITGCKVLDYGAGVADQAAISIGGAAKGTRIVSCIVDGSADDGVNIIPGDYTVVAGFTPGALADITIEGCTLRNCAHLGIELQSTTRTRIVGNTFHNCGSGGAHATIGLRGDGNFGQGDDTGCRIIGNTVTTPGRASVEVSTSGTTPPSGVVITDNDLAKGTLGVAIQDLTRPAVWERHNIIDGSASKVITYAAADTTPSVRGAEIIVMNSPGVATTITALDEMTEGQTTEVHFRTGFYTVDFSGTTLKGNGGVDWVPANGDKMVCTKQGSNVYCIVADCSP